MRRTLSRTFRCLPQPREPRRSSLQYDLKRRQYSSSNLDRSMPSPCCQKSKPTSPFTTKATKMMYSFYQRVLPETCVAFASQEGKKIFASAMANQGLKTFFLLIQQFTTQTEPAFCGLSTLVLVLNALGVDPMQNWKGPWRWYEESMLNCCLDLEHVKQTGITLKDFQCMAHCQGLSVDLTYHDDARSNLDHFREAVRKACVDTADSSLLLDNGTADQEDSSDIVGVEPTSVLVASYSRTVMGQTGSGHFSPLAAYDASSDSVLILDTARFKYGAHWAKLPHLYSAMEPIDKDTGRSRGYALLSFVPHDTASQIEEKKTDENAMPLVSVQPRSLLFRSKFTQHPARREYKEFLKQKGTEITREEACNYWIEPKAAVASVWSILEPLRLLKKECEGPECTLHSEEEHAIPQMRDLLQDLLRTVQNKPIKCCDGTDPDKACVSDTEALFVIYLASLAEERRRDIIMKHPSKASQFVRDLLLNEVNLVAIAIECSDQTTT